MVKREVTQYGHCYTVRVDHMYTASMIAISIFTLVLCSVKQNMVRQVIRLAKAEKRSYQTRQFKLDMTHPSILTSRKVIC